jgi:hypothetical protein
MKRGALSAPVNDLHLLGIQLQGMLDSTAVRVAGIKSPSLKLRALRAMDSGRFLFKTLSNLVQTTDGLLTFLIRHMDINIDDIFSMTGNKKNARITTRSALTMVNVGVQHIVDELIIINREIDNEVKQNG